MFNFDREDMDVHGENIDRKLTLRIDRGSWGRSVTLLSNYGRYSSISYTL